jgi:tetratricopeptide (TPR) repeat protein
MERYRLEGARQGPCAILSLLLAAALAGCGGAQHKGPIPVCAHLGGAIAGTWNPRVRAEILAANKDLKDSNGQPAAMLAEVAAKKIDGDAKRWSDLRVEGCLDVYDRETLPEPVYADQTACFDAVQGNLARLVGVLRAGRTESIEEFLVVYPIMVAKALDRCALLVGDKGRERVQIELKLQAGRALCGRGDYRSAFDFLMAAMVEFLALGDDVGSADAAVLMAGGLIASDGSETALKTVADAREDYVKALSIPIYSYDPQTGKSAVTMTFDKVGHRKLANVGLIEGLAKKHLARYDEAIAAYEQAAADAEKADGPRCENRAVALDNLGTLWATRRDFKTALPLSMEALSIFREVSGEKSFHYATTLNNLALDHDGLDQHDEAIKLAEQSLKILQEMLGEDNPGLAAVWDNLGVFYKNAGKYDQALAFSRKAQDLYRAAKQGKSVDMATALVNEGDIYRRMGRCDEAIKTIDEAIGLAKQLLPPDHPMIAEMTSALMKCTSGSAGK